MNLAIVLAIQLVVICHSGPKKWIHPPKRTCRISGSLCLSCVTLPPIQAMGMAEPMNPKPQSCVQIAEAQKC